MTKNEIDQTEKAINKLLVTFGSAYAQGMQWKRIGDQAKFHRYARRASAIHKGLYYLTKRLANLARGAAHD